MPLWLNILILVIIIIIGLGLSFSIFVLFYISWRVYSGVLVRTSKDKWSRTTCSDPNDKLMMEMWNIGIRWGEKHVQYRKPLTIRNDNLNLAGEFFDFGFHRTAFIVQGRSETCKYSYFYAAPYKDAGYNVLVIDTRAHGMSDGKYNTAGIKESDDVIAWIKYLHDELNQESIIMHTICVGGCATSLAITNENCPPYVHKVIFDGLFVSFLESFALHMKEKGHGKSPIFWMIWFWFRIKGGVSIKKAMPIKVVGKIQIPVLFLFGKEDIFSLPEKSKILFEKCGSQNKKIKWFQHGAHSRLRLINTKEYDDAVRSFIK